MTGQFEETGKLERMQAPLAETSSAAPAESIEPAPLAESPDLATTAAESAHAAPSNRTGVTAHAAFPEDLETYRNYKGYTHRKVLILIASAVLVIASLVWAVCSGSSELTPPDVIAALFGQGTSRSELVVWNLRMPRILTAIAGGFGLGMAGCAFQAVLRNPLASPSTLGISQGAAFGASVAIVLFGAGSTTAGTVAANIVSINNPYIVTLCAFVGSMMSTLLVLGLSRFRQITPESMILAGVALSALFGGATTLIQYFASDVQIAAVVFWTFGDLGRTVYPEIALLAVIVILSSIYFIFNGWNYNAMEGGETAAMGLGVNANTVRLVTMAIGSLVTAVVVSLVGIISFIGLIAPHIMRRFLGGDNRFLLLGSGLMGSILLVLSDLFARMVIAPIVLPIGAITSFLGAPLFLYLLYKGVQRH